MLKYLFAGLGAAALFHASKRRGFLRHAFAGAGGCGSRGPRGFGRISRELGTTPEQEDAMRQSAREVMDAWRKTQAPWSVLGSVASALKAETFDRETFRASASGADENAFRGALAAAIERLRGVLHPEQRARLADLMTRRFSGRHEGHHRGRGFGAGRWL